MGRWGMCLFQGDQDLDIRSETEHDMGLTRDNDDDYIPDEELQSLAFRCKLDAGLCDKLFKDYRSKENTFWIPDRKMYTVVLAAMVMQSGARISDDNMQHLRELVPRIHSSPGYASPLADDGFRDPGKVQFLAALEYYKPGTPRTFCELSCYHCGKIQADLGEALNRCARCKVASYCNKDCQKAHWKAHKPSCFDHKNPPMFLNV
ncbi:hypothetical protein KVR01_004383 [Diaporthe batatas]|uniref:uncharacterized protein n=1 Tax=Diaporthe batatas TaxID=748121 RepID=UPI001D052A0D|nr:uncharacterized protein KVR01_004383 [Diaporthe batatas]KAG8165831.1 hypothetical protein KVR01_004383 [Diaporthe batatas]